MRQGLTLGPASGSLFYFHHLCKCCRLYSLILKSPIVAGRACIPLNMPAIFRQPSTVSCFFCQSVVTPLPRNPRSFRCPHCDCWNRYDERGEIISDEPAMHDENLNARSFAKRGTLATKFARWLKLISYIASPRKDRFPSAYGNAIFCHTCQTNQMLITNLLSNYLPPPGVCNSFRVQSTSLI